MMMMENMLTYLSRPDCLSWLPFVLNNHFFPHQILTFHINVKTIKLKNLPIRDDLNHRYFYRTQVQSLPCLVSQSLRHSVLVLNFVPIVAFVEVVRRISLSRYMDLSNLMQGFLCVAIWICKSYMLLWSSSWSLTNIWSSLIGLKSSLRFKDLGPWARLVFGNVCRKERKMQRNMSKWSKRISHNDEIWSWMKFKTGLTSIAFGDLSNFLFLRSRAEMDIESQAWLYKLCKGKVSKIISR